MYTEESLEKYSLQNISKLREVLLSMPKELTWEINYHGKEYYDIDELLYDFQEKFFDTTLEDYKKIVGKCFVDDDKTVVLKVIGLPDTDYYEFLYEEYHIDDKGNWHHKDYIWLQDEVYGEYPNNKYKKYCLTKDTEMNIAAEGMYHLGKDSNLYVDYTCAGDYCVFKPCKEAFFNYAKEDAIDNDGEYEVE